MPHYQDMDLLKYWYTNVAHNQICKLDTAYLLFNYWVSTVNYKLDRAYLFMGHYYWDNMTYQL